MRGETLGNYLRCIGGSWLVVVDRFMGILDTYMTEKHTHKFKRVDKTITLRLGKAKDTLKQWKCDCGSIQTFDLERKIV